MTRVQKRFRKPFRRHESHKYDKTERFWVSYATKQASNDMYVARNTERFWLEHIQRPRVQRSNSLPGTLAVLPCEFVEEAADVERKSQSILAQARSWMRKVGQAAVPTKVRRGTAHLSRLLRRHPVKAVACCALIYLAMNYTLNTSKMAMSSPVLARYRRSPTWMHLDPVRIIDAPNPVVANMRPNIKTVKYAWKQFNKKWKTSHWEFNGFSNLREAEVAHSRGRAAYEAIMLYHEAPRCSLNGDPLRFMQASNFTHADGLPHFASQCQCTYPIYLWRQIKLAVVPSFLTPGVPQTEDELSRYCPCTKSDAMASWKSFSRDIHPPPIFRITASLPWLTFDWRIWQYKLSGHDLPLRIRRQSELSCFLGQHPGCEKMPGWVSKGDFFRIPLMHRCQAQEIRELNRHLIELQEEEYLKQWDRENASM